MSGRLHFRLGVRTGKAQIEKMFSGLPPTADIGERDCHVSVGPTAEVQPLTGP
jgi:hypothetical protein